MARWLLYGAYGYTGRLLVEEALKQGHRPVVAGRSMKKAAALGHEYDLEWMAFDLADTAVLHRAVAEFDLVFHAAGPFIHTSDPMIQACLAGQAHYLDITGEIPVFQNLFRYDEVAKQRGVALISGVGFDIVPTDCLAAYVAGHVAEPTTLDIGIAAMAGTSAGTTKTMLEMLPAGSKVVRNGRLQSKPFGSGDKKIRFANGKTYHTLPIPWGDLATAPHAIGVENVTTYLALPEIPGFSLVSQVGGAVMSVKPIRRLAQKLVELTIDGPSEQVRQTARSYVWARAANAQGEAKEAWLDTIETYRLTAVAGIQSVEKTLELNPTGALSPSQAFGPDFVLNIEDTHRYDTVP